MVLDTLRHRTWNKETILCFSPLFSRSEWVFQEDIQVHTVQVCFKGVNSLKSMLMHPKDRSLLTKRRMLSTSGNARQMGASLPMLGGLQGLLARGSRNTVNPQPQPYLNTVLSTTTPYLQSLTSKYLTRIPPKSPGRPRKPYIFKGWTLISTEILVKCLSLTALTT